MAERPVASLDDYRLGPLFLLLIVTFGLALLLPGLGGGTRVLTYHEVLFAKPAKEMLTTGDWIVPRFQGLAWEHKPPGNVWLLALSMLIFGSDAEWVVRLSAVLSSILAAGCAASIAARWFGRLPGVTAGLMTLTSYYTLQLGRLGEADMPLVASVAVAMTLFCRSVVDSPLGRDRRWWLPPLFYLVLAGSALVKVIGAVLVPGACGLYMMLRRDRQALRFLLNPLGLLVFATGLVAWPVAAYVLWPGVVELWETHLLGRYTGKLGSPNPWYFYLYILPLIALPWTPWAALAGYRAGRSGEYPRPLALLLCCWLLFGLAFLSISQWRWAHYAAPLVPPITIAAAIGLVKELEERHRSGNPATWRYLTAWLALIVGAVVLLMGDKPWRFSAVAVLGVVAAGLGLAYHFERQLKSKAVLAALFATAWLAIVVELTTIMPHFDSYRTYTELAKRINARLASGEVLHMVALPQWQITYYLDTVTRPSRSVAQLAGRLSTSSVDTVHILTRRAEIPVLVSLGSVEELDTNEPPRPRQPKTEQLVLLRLTRR